MHQLAQAQGCVYEKAVKDKLNRTLLSKLACQVSQYYSAAADYANKSKADIGDGSYNWFKSQSLSYIAASYYQLGIASKTAVEERSEGYGMLVAIFRLSFANYKQAQQIVNANEMHINLSALRSSIQIELDELEKDNKTVYLEVVPDESAVPKLEMLSSVKLVPLTLQDITCQSKIYVEAFDRLVPANVRAKIDEYNNRCQSMLKSISEEVSEITSKVDKYLNEKGLPYVVDGVQSGVPDPLFNKILQIQSKGGVEFVLGQIESVNGLCELCNKMLVELTRDMKDEEDSDNACRDRYGVAIWIRPSSSTLNTNYWNSINGYIEKLNQAKTANQTILEKVDSTRGDAKHLTMSIDQLLSNIPTQTANPSNSRIITPAKQQVLDGLKSLQEARDCQNDEVEKIKKLIAADNINGPLMRARQWGAPYDGVIEEELDKYAKNREDITGMVKTIDNNLSTLKNSYDDYYTAFSNNYDKRTIFLKRLELSANALLEAFTEVSEGSTFFTLLSEYLRTLKQQVGDWVFARKEERQDMLSKIGQDMASKHQSPQNFY